MSFDSNGSSVVTVAKPDGSIQVTASMQVDTRSTLHVTGFRLDLTVTPVNSQRRSLLVGKTCPSTAVVKLTTYRDFTCSAFAALITAADGTAANVFNCSSVTNLKRVLLYKEVYRFPLGTPSVLGYQVGGSYTSIDITLVDAACGRLAILDLVVPLAYGALREPTVRQLLMDGLIGGPAGRPAAPPPPTPSSMHPPAQPPPLSSPPPTHPFLPPPYSQPPPSHTPAPLRQPPSMPPSEPAHTCAYRTESVATYSVARSAQCMDSSQGECLLARNYVRAWGAGGITIGYRKFNITFSDAGSVNCFCLSSATAFRNNGFSALTGTFNLSRDTQQACSSSGSNFARQLLAAKINIGFSHLSGMRPSVTSLGSFAPAGCAPLGGLILMQCQGLSATYLTALADRILDGTIVASDYGFKTGSAGASQISACLAQFNGYFDPNNTRRASASSMCVRADAGHAGHVAICPRGMANPKALP